MKFTHMPSPDSDESKFRRHKLSEKHRTSLKSGNSSSKRNIHMQHHQLGLIYQVVPLGLPNKPLLGGNTALTDASRIPTWLTQCPEHNQRKTQRHADTASWITW